MFVLFENAEKYSPVTSSSSYFFLLTSNTPSPPALSPSSTPPTCFLPVLSSFVSYIFLLLHVHCPFKTTFIQLPLSWPSLPNYQSTPDPINLCFKPILQVIS